MRAAVFLVGVVLLVAGVGFFAVGTSTAASACQQDEGFLGFQSRMRDEAACYESPGVIVAGIGMGLVGLIVSIAGLVIPDERPTNVVVQAAPAPSAPAAPATPPPPAPAPQPGHAAPAQTPPRPPSPVSPARAAPAEATRTHAPAAEGMRLDACPFCGAARGASDAKWCTSCGSELPRT